MLSAQCMFEAYCPQEMQRTIVPPGLRGEGNQLSDFGTAKKKMKINNDNY